MLKRGLIVVGVAFGLAVIYTTGSEQRRSDAENGGAPEQRAACTVVVTADVLNVRSGPGGDHDVVGKLRQDAEIDATTETRDGFRKIDDGEWASDDYLKPVDGADCD
ncbi:SH3 domain-containing protein [Saccharomonospora xinjiangensis]|uniref:SH3 domain-containing protein n=1 Tax=Saccharomonospora xinjiangensis TaxID=75294 RepID=UPI0010C3AD24|nr:SH3 domain-containing protein [Saccharomonospora xinjiangensis]QBQ58958.1 Bacterial SH3 domain protein [Saccharomonospora xinjiangensis]